jgi:plasmid stabilization system protein ParE
MTVSVRFSPPARADIRKYVARDEQEAFVRGVKDDLGQHPDIGFELDEPDDFARAHKIGKMRIYYEVIEGPPKRVRVLRVVPTSFSTPRLQP